MNNDVRIKSYLEFKLDKEINYEDTFEKDDKINKEYTEYLKSMERKTVVYAKNKTRKT